MKPRDVVLGGDVTVSERPSWEGDQQEGAPRRGLLMVYTGNGKGKTTAALGLALRAIGHGQRVYMLQFMKGDDKYGEIQAAKRYLPPLTIVQSGLPSFVTKGSPSEEDLALAGRGVALAREALSSGRYDLVILDEINVALEWGLVTLDDVTGIIRARPPELDLVLTGRYAHQAVIDAADLVSEVREVKHHYREGVRARAGVEF